MGLIRPNVIDDVIVPWSMPDTLGLWQPCHFSLVLLNLMMATMFLKLSLARSTPCGFLSPGTFSVSVDFGKAVKIYSKHHFSVRFFELSCNKCFQDHQTSHSMSDISLCNVVIRVWRSPGMSVSCLNRVAFQVASSPGIRTK